MKQKHLSLVSMALVFSLLCSLFSFPAAATDADIIDPAYAALFPVPETEEVQSYGLYSQQAVYDTMLQGRSIMFLGDSLLAGYGLSDYSRSWCGMLESQYGMEITRNAISGSTFGVSSTYGYQPGGYYEPICQRALPNKQFDVILVDGSGNDWYCEIPLGSDIASRNTYTLIGAMNVVIDRLQDAYPDALILFTTSWNSTGEKNSLGLTTADYNNTFIKVCQARGISYFSACDPAISGIDSASKSFRSQYFLTSTDRWHLNEAGHKKYLPTIAAWLEEMVVDEYTVSGFYDVSTDSWYAAAVKYAHNTGLVNGFSATEFGPEQNMSRGMLVTVLYRAAGKPDVSSMTHPFVDVDATSYYHDAVTWGYNCGIIQGMDAIHFSPDDEVSRQQLATFLFRYSQAQNSTFPAGDLAQFSDSSKVANYALDAISWAVGADILHGMGDGTLCPEAPATRAQTVQLLANYFSRF